MKPIVVLNTKQQCVLQEMIIRRGIVYTPDIRLIAEICDLGVPEVMELVNGTSPAGVELNHRVDDVVAHVPIASSNRQLAYAQMLWDDKINRRQMNDLPLSDRDALDILDYARKHTQPQGVNINVQNNTAQLFDLSSLDYEQLQTLIAKVQTAIETGDIIDGDFTELATGNALATIAGRTSREDE